MLSGTGSGGGGVDDSSSVDVMNTELLSSLCSKKKGIVPKMSELQNAIYGLKKSPWDKLDSGGPGAVEVLVKAMNKKATEIEEAIQATTVMTGSLTARSAAAAAVRRDLDKFDEAIIVRLME